MENEIYLVFLLCSAAFLAGFVDAIVGGGGLIQTPASLVILSAHPVASVIATVKLPSFSGTAFAARQYIKRVSINWKLVALICSVAFFAAFAGSQLLTMVTNSFMKPVLLVVLTAVAIYTFSNKNFGQQKNNSLITNEWLRASIISFVIGFYDGFIGPGAGSFFILAFVAFLGYDFLQASANAKLANMATNLGSLTLFIFRGKILWSFALPMAVSNAVGGFIGAKLAINRGNRFIRRFFLFVVILTLLRFAYDVFFQN